RAALQSLAEDHELRRRLILDGRAHAARFPWRKAVDETWAVYRELLG
ncbi:MAG: glycosyltransferase family 1 protein, partial [Acidobacteria bacterium]|nr:glycosyltransferase family 1 protein [Acidobacteriota bacterium]